MPDPWDAATWAAFIADPLVAARGIDREGVLIGAALIRAVAGEAEVLTIAVAGAERRRGIGAAVLADGLEDASRRGAQTVFLEVAVDNAAALALYRAAGFVEIGGRSGYYRRPDGAVDAVLMSRPLQCAPAG